MEAAYSAAENFLVFAVHWATLILEFMGIIVLVYGGIVAFIGFWKHKDNTRLQLAKNMALALEFKMGGEILRTVIAHDWNDLLQVGAIILLRAALTLLIHWEISSEEKENAKKRLDPPSSSETPKDQS